MCPFIYLAQSSSLHPPDPVTIFQSLLLVPNLSRFLSIFHQPLPALSHRFLKRPDTSAKDGSSKYFFFAKCCDEEFAEEAPLLLRANSTQGFPFFLFDPNKRNK
eukprot:GHVT01009321.1.p1 GENE.GHVT01009321.1~~GHVT01009321.1.p1  ORF type:complete len:104 (+),score=4.62 GHVT01009321.1:307-618(+)